MPNREKIIKEAEEILSHVLPDEKDTSGIMVKVRWIRDTIALLKEQEAKVGTWQWKIHGKAESGGTLGEAVCDQCGKSTYATAVKGDLNYCPNCGANMTDWR